MYPAPFDYLQAGSWPEAVDLLSRLGDEAKVLAGGQSLVPMMSIRLIRPRYIVDVNGAAESGIRGVDGRIEVSALTRHAELERSPVLATSCPLLREAAGFIGNIRVRHRGTIGGSFAHADPSAELPVVAVATGAEISTLGSAGERRHSADSFFQSWFTTSLEPDEVVTSVSFPAFPARRGSAFVELARRVADFATVGAAAIVDLDPDGQVCTGVRLVFGAVSDRPVDASEAAGCLIGLAPDAAAVGEAARRAAAAVDPREDDRASAGYRREMVRVLGGRALLRAVERARSDVGG